MNSLELMIWISLTFVFVKMGDKPIYEHLLDIKQKFDIYFGKYNIDRWEELTE